MDSPFTKWNRETKSEQGHALLNAFSRNSHPASIRESYAGSEYIRIFYRFIDFLSCEKVDPLSNLLIIFQGRFSGNYMFI